MDPLSVSASAAALLTICVQTVQILKTTIETLSSAKEFLLKLLTQTERVRLFLEQLRSLTKQLGHRSEVLLAYNDSAPRETINELNTFVRHMAQSKTWVRLKVLMNQNEADKLVERLHRHEEEIMQVLLSVATASSIRTEHDIQKMYESVVLHSRVASPFSSDETTLVDQPGTLSPPLKDVKDFAVEDLKTELEKINPASTGPSASRGDCPQKPQIWFGDLSRSGFDTRYLSLRDRLAESAFWCDFDQVLQVLLDADREYGQCWVNAPRLSSTPDRSSGWTALHHAVFTGASTQQITRLIDDFGALRLLRTAWTSPPKLPYRNMTAAEIAHELGYTDLSEILAPIIYHSIPHDVLATLQTHFHNLIRENLSSGQNITDLRLPDLVVLTELKTPLMWFPLKPSEPKRSRGYMYRLDGRELLVKSFGISEDGSAKLYRVSGSGALEIEEAIIFNHA